MRDLLARVSLDHSEWLILEFSLLHSFCIASGSLGFCSHEWLISLSLETLSSSAISCVVELLSWRSFSTELDTWESVNCSNPLESLEANSITSPRQWRAFDKDWSWTFLESFFILTQAPSTERRFSLEERFKKLLLDPAVDIADVETFCSFIVPEKLAADEGLPLGAFRCREELFLALEVLVGIESWSELRKESFWFKEVDDDNVFPRPDAVELRPEGGLLSVIGFWENEVAFIELPNATVVLVDEGFFWETPLDVEDILPKSDVLPLTEDAGRADKGLLFVGARPPVPQLPILTLESLGGLVAELPLPTAAVRESRPTLCEGFVVAGLLEGCQTGENKMKYSPCVTVLNMKY